MNNVSVPVNIEDIKQSCSNYITIYNIVDEIAGTVLVKYQNTNIKRKLFGFIPWFNTTQFDKMKFHDRHARPSAIYKLKSDTICEISKKFTSEPTRTKVINVVSDFFDYNFQDNKYRYTINQYNLCLELAQTINKLSREYNTITPPIISVSLSAFGFVNTYKRVEI